MVLRNIQNDGFLNTYIYIYIYIPSEDGEEMLQLKLCMDDGRWISSCCLDDYDDYDPYYNSCYS